MNHELFLFVIGCIAGTVDTIAGGGGIITIPAFMYIGLDPIAAIGTNKLQAAICELSASMKFLKKKELKFSVIKRSLIYTLIGATAGTLFLQVLPNKSIKIIVPFLLLGIFIFHIFPKKQEKLDNKLENIDEKKRNKFFSTFGTSIGFYNGFFGPGTGAIWSISISHFLKVPLYIATMYTKPLNLIGNMTALIWFAFGGQVSIISALSMGAGSFIGGMLGANFVSAKNNSKIKLIFSIMMVISIITSFNQAFNIVKW